MDISQLINGLGVSGLFIWFLLQENRPNIMKILKGLAELTKASEDLTLAIYDLLDELKPNYSNRRDVQKTKQRILVKKSKNEGEN